MVNEDITDRMHGNPQQQTGAIDDTVSDKSSNQFLTDLIEIGATAGIGILGSGYNWATGDFDFGMGLFNYASVAGTFALGHAIFERDKLSPKTIINEIKMGGLYAPALFAFFAILNPYLAGASLLTKGLVAAGGFVAALTPVLTHYLASEDAVKNYKSMTDYFTNLVTHPFKTAYGTMKYVASNLPESVKHALYLTPFIMADIMFVPFAYQLIASSFIRLGFRGLMAMKDKKEEQPAANPAEHPALAGTHG